MDLLNYIISFIKMYKFYNFFVKNSKCKELVELVEPLRCHMVMFLKTIEYYC